MLISEVIKKVTDEHQAVLIRLRKGHVKGQPYEYDVKELFTGNKKGWVVLDGFTASAMLAIYNGLKPENQDKFNLISLPKLIDFTWKHVK